MRSTRILVAMTMVAILPSAVGQSPGGEPPRPEPTRPERQNLPERPTTVERPATIERPAVTERVAPPERPTHLVNPLPPERAVTNERPAPSERPTSTERPPVPERASMTGLPASATEQPQLQQRSVTAEAARQSVLGLELASETVPDHAEIAQTAVARALASREELVERARSMQASQSPASTTELLDRIGRLTDTSDFQGPQTGTGRIGDSARTNYGRTNFGLTVDRVGRDPGNGGSTSGRAGGNRTGGRPPEDPGDPGVSRDPRGPDDTVIYFPRRGNEIDVTLGQRIALIDVMRDQAIDIGDPGPLKKLNQREKNERERHRLQVSNPNISGKNGNGANPPEGPLPPRGKADKGFLAGMKGALTKGRQKIFGR